MNQIRRVANSHLKIWFYGTVYYPYTVPEAFCMYNNYQEFGTNTIINKTESRHISYLRFLFICRIWNWKLRNRYICSLKSHSIVLVFKINICFGLAFAIEEEKTFSFFTHPLNIGILSHFWNIQRKSCPFNEDINFFNLYLNFERRLDNLLQNEWHYFNLEHFKWFFSLKYNVQIS